MMVGFEEFVELKFLLINSRWSGGPGLREEPLEEYLRSRMCEAVRRLPDSADELAEVLIEILRGCSC